MLAKIRGRLVALGGRREAPTGLVHCRKGLDRGLAGAGSRRVVCPKPAASCETKRAGKEEGMQAVLAGVIGG